MERLGLSYRLKWVFNSVEIRENVVATMKEPTAPPLAWWEANCYLVNGYGFPGLVQESCPFVSTTRFDGQRSNEHLRSRWNTGALKSSL